MAKCLLVSIVDVDEICPRGATGFAKGTRLFRSSIFVG
jgi:hypothetical protein